MVTLTFKVSAEEARRIRAQARAERVTVSEFLRRRSSAPPAAVAKPKQVRCRRTGATIFAGMPGRAALTTGAVREMLADFP